MNCVSCINTEHMHIKTTSLESRFGTELTRQATEFCCNSGTTVCTDISPAYSLVVPESFATYCPLGRVSVLAIGTLDFSRVYPGAGNWFWTSNWSSDMLLLCKNQLTPSCNAVLSEATLLDLTFKIGIGTAG